MTGAARASVHNATPGSASVIVLEWSMSWFTQWLRKESTSTHPRHAIDARDGRRHRQEPRLPAAEQLMGIPVAPVGARRR